MRRKIQVCSVCQAAKEFMGVQSSCDCGGLMVVRDLELKTHQEQIQEMLRALGLPTPDQPQIKDLNFDLLVALVTEETEEFQRAMNRLESAISRERNGEESVAEQKLGAWAEVIDAICDLEVVIHNTSVAMGLDIEPFFQEVHRSNLAKVGGPIREDGKRLKPEGWRPPRILELLENLIKDRYTV